MVSGAVGFEGREYVQRPGLRVGARRNPTLSGLLVIMKIGAPEWFQVPWDSKGANTCSAQDSESERGGIPLSPVC